MSEDLSRAVAALASAPAQGTRSVTSDLSIDETLLLHGAGYEPVDLVSGVSVQSIPYGAFMIPYGQGAPVAIPSATQAFVEAFRVSAERLRRDCARAGGVGVVGADVEVAIEHLSVEVIFTGTAVRPIGSNTDAPAHPFVTDLSVRDFVLLQRAGWEPLDITAGAGFVGSPLRGARQVLAQSTQNVEKLTNLTQALQNAREEAMDRMQQGAIAAGASGVVDVTIIDGPLGHSAHVLGFICYGTAVRLAAEQHRRIEPEIVVSLDDDVLAFEATSLR